MVLALDVDVVVVVPPPVALTCNKSVEV
jgi:hypothetical protein